MFCEKIVENFWVTSVLDVYDTEVEFVSDAVFLSIYLSKFDKTLLSLIL